MVDIVAQAGKNGFLYVLDRVTGKPIWPIVERPVPQSDMPGEHSWPTQPFPTAPPPFATQSFTPDDVDPYIADPAERAKIKQELQDARNEGIYTPASTKNTVEMPGNNGGGNWGGGAVDPPTGILYIETKNAPSMIKLEPHQPKRQMTGSPQTQGRILYIQNCQACSFPGRCRLAHRCGPGEEHGGEWRCTYAGLHQRRKLTCWLRIFLTPQRRRCRPTYSLTSPLPGRHRPRLEPLRSATGPDTDT
jgi:hypothetical protein